MPSYRASLSLVVVEGLYFHIASSTLGKVIDVLISEIMSKFAQMDRFN